MVDTATSNGAAAPKLSIVATLYRSASYVREFCDRAARCAKEIVADEFEIILVNDGSPDDSLAVALEVAEVETNVVVIDLSRNFGHHKAIMTGLSYAKGDKVFLIDSDLEEEPEWLAKFWLQLSEQKCDVVFGVQARRKGGLFERISGQWFYRLFNALTRINLPPNIVVARLMTRRYLAALLRHQEREVFLPGLWQITGFEQRSCVVTKHSTSETTYSLSRKISILINAVTSFSNTPLYAIFYFGVAISVLSGAATAYLVGRYYFWAHPLSGWTSVMASLWLIGGLIISFVGVIGIYLAKIFSEAKHRPYTIVRHIYDKR